MGEVWGAAIMVVGSVVAGKAAEKKAKADQKHDVAMTAEESKLASQRTGYERALEDYYTQKQRARTQRGLDQFRQFSTMSEFAPGYNINSEQRIDEGEAPNYNTFDPDYDPNAPAQEAEAPARKKGRSIHKKLADPLGLF